MPDLKDQRILWLRRNRGVLARLARKLDYSNEMIRSCFYGDATSKDNRIERELAKLGAPGFESFLKK